MTRLAQLRQIRVERPGDLSVDLSRLVAELEQELRDARAESWPRPTVTPWQSGTFVAKAWTLVRADCALGNVLVQLPKLSARDAATAIWLVRRSASNVVQVRPASDARLDGGAAGAAATLSTSLGVRLLVWLGDEWRLT